jgi:DNA-binding NarL/FixJ family response regulator
VRALNREQLQVLGQLAEGLTNREIARRLRLSEPTVKKLVHEVIARLGLANRTQAAVMALSVSLGLEANGRERKFDPQASCPT